MSSSLRVIAGSSQVVTGLQSHFMAVQVVVLDAATGAAISSVAGMDPPLVLRGASGDAAQFGTTGPLIGVVSDFEYTDATLTLADGDLLAMFTDGIVEARDAHRKFFDVEGVIKALKKQDAAENTMTDLANKLLADTVEFCNGANADDMCILLARLNRQNR